MNLKQQMKQQMLKGVLVKVMDHPSFSIIAKQCGMDFLFYDCEHGMIPYHRLEKLILMGTAEGIPSIVRVAQLARRDVSQALDCGADGVMVPMIETVEQAKQLVAWSKYPPLGIRSYSGGANTHYRPSGSHAENMREAESRILSIAQIETKRGVEHADEILSVEGIDAVIVGPCDLGISIQNPDDVMVERELKMIQYVADACTRHHKGFGIIGGMQLQRRFKNQLSFLVSAIDVQLIRDGLRRAVEEYEKLTG